MKLYSKILFFIGVSIIILFLYFPINLILIVGVVLLIISFSQEKQFKMIKIKDSKDIYFFYKTKHQNLSYLLKGFNGEIKLRGAIEKSDITVGKELIILNDLEKGNYIFQFLSGEKLLWQTIIKVK